MDAKTRGDRGQGTGDRGQGTGDRGILQKGRQGYLRLSCEQRQEQDKSGARLPTTRVSYAPRASRNSPHSHENDLSNRPHFLWVYRRDNSRGMFGEHDKKLVNHEPKASDLQASRMFSQHPKWFITPVNPQKVWSVGYKITLSFL